MPKSQAVVGYQNRHGYSRPHPVLPISRFRASIIIIIILIIDNKSVQTIVVFVVVTPPDFISRINLKSFVILGHRGNPVVAADREIVGVYYSSFFSRENIGSLPGPKETNTPKAFTYIF